MKKFYGNFCKIKCRKGLFKRFEKCLAVILENPVKSTHTLPSHGGSISNQRELKTCNDQATVK